MLIDTHAHLNVEPLFEKWSEVVEEANLAGITQFIVPGADIPSSTRGVSIAHQHPSVYAAVGIHPETLLEFPEYDLSRIDKLATDERVVGIGEIGLDYFRDHAASEVQRKLFREQLAVAKFYHLPAVIHSRTDEAMQDAVSDIKAVYGSTSFTGVFHCFSGSQGFYETITSIGSYIGVGGMITYDHQKQLQEVISAASLENIVLETDAPWLVPQPRPRGVNTPANITIVAAKLAELLGVQLTEVLETTSRNVHRLFPQLGLHI